MEKLGIVFYGRVKSILVGLLSLWIAVFIFLSLQQDIGAYLNKQGFDVTIHDFLLATWALFFPYLLVSALFIRSLTARLAFYRVLKRQIVYPEYEPPAVLSPAEAGLLMDNEFHMSEVAATIINLELKGNLSLKDDGMHLLNQRGLSPTEEEFIEDLFGSQNQFAINPANSTPMLDAGKKLAENTRQQLIKDAQLTPSRKSHKTARLFIILLVCLAVFVQLLLTVGFLMGPKEFFSINYPRYPMTLAEPVSTIITLVIFFVIAFSGFWQKTFKNNDSITKWQYVAGLKVYIETVYKNNFYDGSQLLVSQKELKTFYPYAVALGIEKDFTDQLEHSMLT